MKNQEIRKPLWRIGKSLGGFGGRATQGTAAFHNSRLPEEMRYRKGHLFLGRDEAGELIGISPKSHALLLSSSQSGKGVSTLIPIQTTFPGSMVITDLKGDNAYVTHRRRGKGSKYCHGMGQKTILLDPYKIAGDSESSGSYNPMDGIKTVRDARAAAKMMIIVSDPKDNHWNENCCTWIAAVILYAIATEEAPKRTLRRVRILLTRGDTEAAQGALEILRQEDPDAQLPPGAAFDILLAQMKLHVDLHDGFIAASAEAIEQMCPEERSGVVSFARTNTAFLDEAEYFNCMETSSFSFDELKLNKDGMSLYLCLPPNEFERDPRWLRLLIMQALDSFVRLGQGPSATGHKTLFMLDEAACLRHLAPLESSMGYIASYGVTLLSVFQDLSQIQANFKDTWPTFLGNSGLLIASGNNDPVTVDYLSTRFGMAEIRQATRNTSRTHTEGNQTTASDSRSTGGGSGESTHSGTNRSSSGFGFVNSSSGSSSGRDISTSKNWTRTRQTSTGTNESVSDSEGMSEVITTVPLMRPDEIEREFASHTFRQVIKIAGHSPIILEKVEYFSDPFFEGMFEPHPGHPDTAPLTLEQIAIRDAERRQMKELEETKENQAIARGARNRLLLLFAAIGTAIAIGFGIVLSLI